MIETFQIREGGIIHYDPVFFDAAKADILFERIRAETPWRQEHGRFGPFPRLTAWYADTGLTYSYSGVTHEATPWTDTLHQIRVKVEAAAATSFNSLLLNRYRAGSDSMGYHADDEPELGVNPVIASVSFGAVRRFVLKHKKTGERLRYDLAHGSLLIMAGTCQHHWIHAVPKTKAELSERINLTFRRIIPA